MKDLIFKTLTSDFRTSLWQIIAYVEGGIYHCNISDKNEFIKFRENFGIGSDERIIFCRDNSFFSTAHKQGVVITDQTVYYIPDSDYPENKMWFSWLLVKSVEYDGESLNFSFSDGEVFSIPISLFQKKEFGGGDYRKNEVAGNLVDMFNDLAYFWNN